MDAIHHATEIIEQAESSIRKLIREEVDRGRYDRASPLLRLAKGLAEVRSSAGLAGDQEARNESTGTQEQEDNAPTEIIKLDPSVHHNRAHESSTASSGKVAESTHSNESFPRFVRENDFLVKLGWSKKNDSPYEHRAPKDIVLSVANTIHTEIDANSVFSMQDLLPFETEGGDNIPSYQAYLTVAWLRQAALVAREGRSDYRLKSDNWDVGALEEAWMETPSRRQGKST